MGFRLEEMQGLVKGGDYYVVGSCFRSKINELREQEHAIHNSYVAVRDWYELIQEARTVLYNKIQEVGVRYVSEEHYCYMDQEFEYHYMDSIINISWVNYLDTVKNEITGPVILEFPSWKEKWNEPADRLGLCRNPSIPAAAERMRLISAVLWLRRSIM